jgi:hypothetical protein
LFDETGCKYTANELIPNLPELKDKHPWLRVERTVTIV